MPESSPFPDGKCDDFEATEVFIAQADEDSLQRRTEEAFGEGSMARIFDMQNVKWDVSGRKPATVLAGRLAEGRMDATGKKTGNLTEADYYALLALETIGSQVDVADAVWEHARETPAALHALARSGDEVAQRLCVSGGKMRGLLGDEETK